MNEKNAVGTVFYAVLFSTLLVVLALIVVLFNLIIGSNFQEDEAGDVTTSPSVTPVVLDSTPLFPTTPSRESYIIGKADNVVKISDEIRSNNTILVDLESMTSIVEKEADAKIYPASMTKVMTLLVACENVKDLDETLTITQEHIDYYTKIEDGSSFFAMADLVGEQLSVKDALYLISFESDTISCILMAEHIAGGEEAFVSLMNKKATELGLSNTHFANCTGIYNENHYSTCREIATIMAYALENELAHEILFSTTYSFSSYKFYTADTTDDPDKKITYYPSAEWYKKNVRFNAKPRLETSVVVAGKTGYIDESGVSLVSVAKSYSSGKYYINVIVGQPKGSGLDQSKSTQEVKYIYNNYIK